MLDVCDVASSSADIDASRRNIKVYPNPSDGIINVHSPAHYFNN